MKREYKPSHEKRPSDYALTTEHLVSVLQEAQAREPIENIIRRDMERRLAAHIAGERIEREARKDTVAYRMRIYVLSAEELYSLINREALRIASQPYSVDLGGQ